MIAGCQGSCAFVQGNHSIVQLASGDCPTAATPASQRKELVPASVNGSGTLTFPSPGTVRDKYLPCPCSGEAQSKFVK